MKEEDPPRKKKKISKKANKTKILLLKQPEFKKAVDLVKQGFSYKYICGDFGIKENSLKKAVYNAKKSLPYPQKKNRKEN